MNLQEQTTAAMEQAFRTAPPWLRGRTTLLIRAGSHACGVALPTSDIDLRGVAIPHRASYFGFAHRFENFTSKVPDCDIPELRFFMRSAAEGESNALQTLFCEDEDVLVSSVAGRELRRRRDEFLSRRVVKPFSGMAHRYIEKARRAPKDNAKSAMHAVRLTRMLREILVTGEVRVRRRDADELLAIRRGECSVEQALVEAEGFLKFTLHDLAARSPLPEQADTEALNAWCVELVERFT